MLHHNLLREKKMNRIGIKAKGSQCIMLSRDVKIHKPQAFLPTPYLVD